LLHEQGCGLKAIAMPGAQVLLDLLYCSALAVGSPWCAWKLLTRRKIRAGLREKLGGVPRRSGPPCAWFHCVSVGEANLARELIARFERRLPDCPVAVSCTTDTGRAALEKHLAGRDLFYYPFDLSPAVRKTFGRVRPRCIILIELELWPNLLLTARDRGVPVVVINGRIEEPNFRRLSHVRFLVAPLLKTLRAICVQDDVYARRLVDLGAPPERVLVTGNMKYDAVRTEIDPGHPACRAIRGLGPGPVVVGGCTWPGEDEILLRIHKEAAAAHPGLRLVLAPRHAERLPSVERLVEDAGFACRRLSTLKMHPGSGENVVVLVDTVGELDAVYAAGDIVFVGKSLTQHGGHNILEPAALGKPVLFGPHTENFRDAAALLLDAAAAVKVDSEAGLREQITQFLAAPAAFAQLGTKAKAAVAGRKGATERNLEVIESIVASCA